MKKSGKAFMVVLAVLGIAGLTAHVIWKYSGSNRWEYVGESKGVQLYKMKSPGSTLTRYKGVIRVRVPLSSATAMLLDPRVCDYDPIGCFDSTQIEQIDDRSGYYRFRWRLPYLFRPREFLVKATFQQDPRTKEVFERIEAAPDRLSPSECCVRVTYMHNTWRLTPQPNGEIQVEYVVDLAPGGFFPYFLSNLGNPRFVPNALSKVGKWMQKEKYRNAKVAFLHD